MIGGEPDRAADQRAGDATLTEARSDPQTPQAPHLELVQVRDGARTRQRHRFAAGGHRCPADDLLAEVGRARSLTA